MFSNVGEADQAVAGRGQGGVLQDLEQGPTLSGRPPHRAPQVRSVPVPLLHFSESLTNIKLHKQLPSLLSLLSRKYWWS